MSTALFNQLMQGSLYNKKLEHSLHTEKRQYRAGCVAVVTNKENLATDYGTKGFIVHSIEKLDEVCDSATHWTPNPFTYLEYVNPKYTNNKRTHIKGHTRDSIKQINSFVFDIDDENLTANELSEALIEAHFELSIPTPNLIVKTPRGYHLYFTLDKPFYANRNTGFKAIRMAEKINNNLKHALSQYLPIDPACVPFGFFRMPNKHNIIWRQEDPVNHSDLIKWSYDYSKNTNTDVTHKNNVILYRNAVETPEWIKKMFDIKHVKGGTNVGRNSVIFTLALYYYGNRTKYEKAYNILNDYNASLDEPLKEKEFNRVMEQAYSGAYSGASKEYVLNIIDNYLEEDIQISTNGWYKHRKPREKRIRTHNHEHIDDIKAYLEANTNDQVLYIEDSITGLCKTLNIARSTFNHIISRDELSNNNIIIQKSGKGRYAKTRLILKNLFLHRLFKLAKKQADKKRSFKQALMSLIKEDSIQIVLETKESSQNALKHALKRFPIFDDDDVEIFIRNNVIRI